MTLRLSLLQSILALYGFGARPAPARRRLAAVEIGRQPPHASRLGRRA